MSLGVGGERRRYELYRFVATVAAQQQFRRMMRGGAIARRQPMRAQRQIERQLAIIGGEQAARQVAKHQGVVGLDLRGARKIADRVLVQPDAGQ